MISLLGQVGFESPPAKFTARFSAAGRFITLIPAANLRFPGSLLTPMHPLQVQSSELERR